MGRKGELVKRLIVVRHGESYGDALTDVGRAQAERLGTAIREIVSGGTFAIMTSDRVRAQEMGGIISRTIGDGLVGEVVRDCLTAASSFTEETASAIGRLGTLGDVVIVVSHDFYVQRAVTYYRDVLGISWRAWTAPATVKSATGVVIDFEAKTITPISHE